MKKNLLFVSSMYIVVILSFIAVTYASFNQIDTCDTVNDCETTENIKTVQVIEIPSKAEEEFEVSETLREINVQYEQFEVIQPMPDAWMIDSGDTLWKIAETVYGNGSMYPYLMEINNMETDIVNLGQIIEIKYFNSNEEYTAKLNECYAKIKEWSVPVNGKPSGARNFNKPSNMTYVGKFYITGYDAWCAHCCSTTNGITASGKVATVGQTVAASSKQFKLGTKLYIEGYGTYVVEDRGVGKGVIDIATSSHNECNKLTARGINVYIVK